MVFQLLTPTAQRTGKPAPQAFACHWLHAPRMVATVRPVRWALIAKGATNDLP
jgi:hypothetical protein